MQLSKITKKLFLKLFGKKKKKPRKKVLRKKDSAIVLERKDSCAVTKSCDESSDGKKLCSIELGDNREGYRDQEKT
jgi:hypothetical protein